MGLFRRLFGGGEPPGPPPEEQIKAPAEEPLVAVVVLRRGMNVPTDDYVAEVVAREELRADVPRFGLSQPSWFKTDEIADAIATEVAATFARKLELETHWHRRRATTGPEGAPVLIVELLRAG